MQTPDVTPIQKLVGAAVMVVGSALTLLAAFGIELTVAQQGAITGFVGTVGTALVIADAVIRHGRSKIAANPEAVREMQKPAAPVFND